MEKEQYIKVVQLGKWIAQLKVGGKRKTIATGNSSEEVQVKLEKAKVELREGVYIDKSNITVGQILEQNLKNQECSNKICQSTMLRNRETAKVIFKSNLASMPIQSVHRQDIQDFLNEIAQKYSNSYIDKIHIQLSNVFKKAYSDEYIRKNYFAMGDIEKPNSIKTDKEVDALTIEEHRKFIEQLRKKDYKYKSIFYILFETGMRVGEVLALTPQDIDYMENVIHVRRTLSRDSKDKAIINNHPKTKAGLRDIPLTQHLIQVFKEETRFKIGKALIFAKSDGKPISTSTINTHFKKIAKDAGIRVITYPKKKTNGRTSKVHTSTVTTHQIRHSFRNTLC